MEDEPGTGTVYLVGAGPGDPDLLTRKAHRLICEADVLLYDSLVSAEIRDLIPADTESIDVGKRPDGERTTQSEINTMLLKHTRAGRDIVRLKGGDPTLFARGGEEAEHLTEAGVAYEFVPGVTSVVGAPAQAGFPITHREHSSTATIIPGREDPSKEDSALDWDAIARTITAGGTLIILMGVGRLPSIAHELVARGVPAETPAATIQDATLDSERTVRGTVGTIGQRIREENVKPPATTVVGAVADVGTATPEETPQLEEDAQEL